MTKESMLLYTTGAAMRGTEGAVLPSTGGVAEPGKGGVGLPRTAHAALLVLWLR